MSRRFCWASGVFVFVWMNAIGALAQHEWIWRNPLSAQAVVEHGDEMVAVGKFGMMHTSVDGRNWTQRRSLNGTLKGAWSAWSINGKLFIAQRDDEQNSGTLWVGTSPDDLANRLNAPIMGVAFGKGVYIAVGLGAFYMSTNGVAWRSIFPGRFEYGNSVAFGAGKFIAAHRNGITSPDGWSWAALTIGGVQRIAFDGA